MSHLLGRFAAAIAVGLILSAAWADGPKDNIPENVRQVPPKGVTVPDADRNELQTGLADLQRELDTLPAALKGKADLLGLTPDVEVFHKAVRYAVEHDEFMNPREIESGKKLIRDGLQRAKELKDGMPSWTTATGLVVRGYRSKIDGSVQPYGLVVPKSYDPNGGRKHRLDFWWHGRDENVCEIGFITRRQSSFGEFTPPDAIVLHPYGRFSNANKFAGEIDTLECLDHAKKHYRIDENRVVARGFSMGGASCWQFAVHYPTLWAAAAPGAGFAETPEFLNNFQGETVKPTWWEERLWRMYNATDYAQNIYNVPTVAYSGEIDKQKQAADVMAREMKKVGLELTHIIGPKTAHNYEKNAKAEVSRRIDEIVEKSRDPMPKEIKFVTYTLRYNRCGWLTVQNLEKHWEPAQVEGVIEGGKVVLKTKNVRALSVTLPANLLPASKPNTVVIDGDSFAVDLTGPTNGGCVHFAKFDRTWLEHSGGWKNIHKEPGLQGPIDDAFMDRFLMVRPTSAPLNEKVGAWADTEMKHAIKEWRRQFRGDAPVTDDIAVTDDDIKNANLVLWGDPTNNKVLAKIADKLPVKWTKDGVVVGDQTYDAATHVPLLIYPNPLNPSKYIVLNSGFTYREYDYLNNARQTPKLPDYAVIDTTTPPNSRWPGKVVRAGFFGEKWELLADDGK